MADRSETTIPRTTRAERGACRAVPRDMAEPNGPAGRDGETVPRPLAGTEHATLKE